MRKVNLFIVGAAKAGTTSIHNYLSQHKDIYMSPVKEPHFFSHDIRCDNFSTYYKKQSCFNINKYFRCKILKDVHSAYNITKLEDYMQLFREAKDERYLGEASVGYLYSKVAAEEIYNYNKNAKIIIVLRDPSERAFSHWKMDLRSDNVNRKSFQDAVIEDLNAEEKGWGRNHLYIELGKYHGQIERYIKLFPRNQILILFYDDLNNNFDTFMNRIYDFLNIETDKLLINKKHNKLFIPKYPKINRLIRKFKINTIVSMIFPKTFVNKVKKMMSIKKPLVMTEKEKDFSYQYFKKDIEMLQQLISYDLSSWK